MDMNMKRMGFTDKVIFILGLTLSGVLAFVLVMGVIVALLKLYMDGKKRSITIHSVPIQDDEQEAVLLPVPFEQRLAEAIELHEEAMGGNAAAVREADRIFEQLRQDHPGHAITDAYHGSIMVLLARNTSDPMNSRKWEKHGLKLLDEAVASLPQDFTLRMLRCTAASRLAERPFDRAETAIEDYIHLLEWDLRQPGILDTETCSKLIYELGEAYRRVDRQREAGYCFRRLNEIRTTAR